MKKSIYFLSIFLFQFFAGPSIQAQQTSFEYLLTEDKGLYFGDIMELENDEIVFCGGISNLGNSDSMTAYIAKISSVGYFIDSIHSTENLTHSFYYALHMQDANSFLAIANLYSIDTVNQQAKISIDKFDEYLSVKGKTYLNIPSSFDIKHVTSHYENDGKLMIGGAFTLTNELTWRPFVYVLDNEFDSLVSKFYEERTGSIWKLNTLPNNKYWFIISIKDKYYCSDSSLNILSEQRIPNYLKGNIGVKWDTDSSFYLVGDKLFTEPSHNLGFIKQYDPIDTTGHLFNQWGISDTIDLPAVSNGIDFRNKDSIFIGGTRNVYLGYYNPWPSWFIVLQTDSLLNIRWERFYGGDAYYVMGKIIASKDGGCIIGGTRYDYQNVTKEQADIIVLKLNAEGLIVGNDESSSIKMHEAIVYPNPGTTEIKVRIAAQYWESLFQLFEMNGKQVASEKIFGKFGSINTNFLKPGTYIYRISSKDGLFETGKWVKQ